jgi:uncharacterized protein YfaS (alpha-2-macroglobulin family)
MSEEKKVTGEGGATGPSPDSVVTQRLEPVIIADTSLRTRISKKISLVHERIQSFVCAHLPGSHPRAPRVLAVLFTVVLLLSGVLGYQFLGQPEIAVPVKQFTNVYSFVPEKISKSAEIPISIPAGVDEAVARAGISFSPEVKGEWVIEDLPNRLLYKPEKPLREKVYYAINMDTPGAQMSGDFYVDEDPMVDAVFPGAESEAHEESEITIVFNRPMVPLTTLETSESIELPITITPPTEGRFKWVSTRTLQFIPATTLIPSSAYTVSIAPGLTSVDGLPVLPYTHMFTTRPLRYEHLTEGETGYRTPITIAFNQEVSLEKTRGQIVVTRDGDAVPIDVTYGESATYDWKTGKTTITENRASLFVYQKQDTHGRERLWDFDTTYVLTIAGAETPRGTTPLAEGKSVYITTPNIVAYVEAESTRTSRVRTDMFDPQGTLVVHFYDEVDISKTDFTVPGFKAVAYGERCALDRDGNEIAKGNGCEKEPDRRVLRFTFKEDAFSLNQDFTLLLEKVYTVDGLKINPEPYPILLKTYPVFAVTKTVPGTGTTTAPLDMATICSTVPLADLSEDESLKKYVHGEGYIVYGRWYGSEYIESGSWYTGPCAVGEFETLLHYGLLPSTPYTLSFTLTDAFGQTVSFDRNFTTKEPGSKYTRLHNLQQQYNVTRPGRTKLTYAAENLETIDVHFCKMSPETFLNRTVDGYAADDAPLDSECIAVVRDTITLPPRYWVNNYFQIDLEKYFPDVRGQYVVTLSSPLYIDEYNMRKLYDRTLVSVTNMAVGTKEIGFGEIENAWARSTSPATYKVLAEEIKKEANLYWVNDSTSLAAIPGVTVTQYQENYDYDTPRVISLGSGVTDTAGIARVAVGSRIAGAVIRNGADAAVVSNWSDRLGYAGQTESASRTYIYTDRPIYRPGQTVYLRGIDRIGFDASYEVWTKDPVALTVDNSRGEEIYNTTLPVSVYGTFSSSFEIPQNAPLGNYRISAFGQDTYISVEEYVPAAFKVETKTTQDEYTDGDTIDVGVQADYYFGVPLDGGTVTYAITAQDYYFDRYTDEYFNFGSNWYSCYSCGYGDSFMLRGETRLDEKGHANISRELKLAEYFDEGETVGSKLVTVSITVKDQNGRSVSSQRSFVVHKGAYYLGVQTSEYYTGVKTPVTLRVKSVDTQGAPIAVKGIERVVSKIEWETFKRQEVDGGYYYRSEPRKEVVSREKIATDGSGNWSGTLTFDAAGEYEVVISGTDAKGNHIETQTSLYIYGDTAVYVPPNNNYELDLEMETSAVDVGDTATILIKSPYPRAKVLIAAERGTVYDYWIVEVIGGFYKHTFEVKEAYAPNVQVSALLLSPDPEVKFGSVNFSVGSTAHTLTVDVTSNKSTYLPGESVMLTVRTTNAGGQGEPAEVSLAVADLSVLALRGNPKKDPLVFFYDGFPLAVTTGSNIKNILYEAEIPIGTKGGGGGDPDDLSRKQRGVFKDTAYWNASLITNAEGYGTAMFTLPDNLTSWRVEALGVTTNTKLGVDYAEFLTQKEFMAVPLKPRFVVPGDTFSLGAQVFNQSDRAQEIVVTLESESLEFLKERTASIFVDAGDSQSVFFSVRAPKAVRTGVHTFTFTAQGVDGVDSVAQEIAITPNNVYETVATAHFTKDDSATEYLYVPEDVVTDEGGLTVHANATLAVFMSDALTYMAAYPYGCSEQIASALSTIAMVKRAVQVPGVDAALDTISDARGVPHTVNEVVESGLARIYESQAADGGIAYYKGLRSNVSLTVSVVLALGELEKAGFVIREDVLARALGYIELETMSTYRRYPEYTMDDVVLAEYTLRTVGGRTETTLAPIIESFIDDKAILNEKLNSMTLGYLAILTTTGYSTRDRDRVYEVLTNRIDIDGRGAYLTNPAGAMRGYYETPVANTALLLRAFIAHEDEHVMLGNVLRTLLASRDRDGVWGSTQNTSMVVTALVEYLAWQHETESRFTLRGLLDGVEVFVEKFTPENVFSTVTRFIPMADLKKGTLLPLTFERTMESAEPTNFYYDLALKYYLSAAKVPPRDEGITITRGLYALTDTEARDVITTAAVGDIVRGKLTITIPDVYQDVAIEDIIPAGFEIVNLNLDTEDQSLRGEGEEEDMYYEGGYGYGDVPSYGAEDGFFARAAESVRSFFGGEQTAQVSSWYEAYTTPSNTGKVRTLRPTHMESHDDRVFLFVESLTPGVYEYEYFLRALVPGEFQHLPAHAEELYFPEIFGRTEGGLFTVTEAK